MQACNCGHLFDADNLGRYGCPNCEGTAMSESIMFDNVPAAVAWAEEWTTRPDCKTMFTSLVKHNNYLELSREEIIDIAHTISLIAASTDPPYVGLAMKAVYGCKSDNRDKAIAGIMAGCLRLMLYGDQKTHEQLLRLCGAAIKDVRGKEIRGRGIGWKRWASEVGVSRKAIIQSQQWPVLVSQSIDLLQQWLNTAEHQIGIQLEDRHWLA